MNWKRLPVTAKLAPYLTPGTVIYQKDLEDGHLSVFISREPSPAFALGRWHLSISHRTNDVPPQPGRLPTWDEIFEARYRFVPNTTVMAMYLPPKEEYINHHPTTMHLWELTD